MHFWCSSSPYIITASIDSSKMPMSPESAAVVLLKQVLVFLPFFLVASVWSCLMLFAIFAIANNPIGTSKSASSALLPPHLQSGRPGKQISSGISTGKKFVQSRVAGRSSTKVAVQDMASSSLCMCPIAVRGESDGDHQHQVHRSGRHSEDSGVSEDEPIGDPLRFYGPRIPTGIR